MCSSDLVVVESDVGQEAHIKLGQFPVDVATCAVDDLDARPAEPMTHGVEHVRDARGGDVRGAAAHHHAGARIRSENGDGPEVARGDRQHVLVVLQQHHGVRRCCTKYRDVGRVVARDLGPGRVVQRTGAFHQVQDVPSALADCLGRDLTPPDGVEQLLPVRREDGWQFRVRPGVDAVRFGLPGLRLGYARDATSSYFVFRTLREQGVLPRDMRFQVSIPMVNSVVRPLYFPEPGDVEKIRPGFEAALAAELAIIVKRIPAQDLAIQWDCAWEVSAVHGTSPGKEAEIETQVAPIRRLSAILPSDVALGFHFCFGTFGGWQSTPTQVGTASRWGFVVAASQHSLGATNPTERGAGWGEIGRAHV